MLKKLSSYLPLILIVILALFLRFVKVPDFPPALNWDEVSHGYNAYSILKTGSDEWGQKLPVINFRAYGDYPLPLNLYLTIPSIILFGLTEGAIRLPHLLLGVLTTISAYFVGWGLTKKRNFAFLVGLLVAVGPWYLFPSKVVLQSNLSVFLMVTFLALFLNREKYECFLPLSLFCLFLTLFSYHSTRIFSPLLLVSLLIVFRKDFLLAVRKPQGVLSALIILLFVGFLPVIFFNSNSQARSKWVFLINEGAVNKIIEQRQTSKLTPSVSRLLYNRPVYFVKEFTNNYLGYFSPKYLFFDGGTQYQFSLPRSGMLPVINLPFFYLGLAYLIYSLFKKKDKNYLFLFIWLVLSPVPASLTTEKYAVLRSTTMLPLPEILVGLGLFYVWTKVKQRISNDQLVYLVYILSLGLCFEQYATKLVKEYPIKYSWAWQYGYKEVAAFIKDKYSDYDKIIVTKKYGEPHEYLLFYLKWDPGKYKKDVNLIRFGQSDWFWVDRFDKFYFVNAWQIPKNSGIFALESKKETVNCNINKCLLITDPGNYPVGWDKLKTINFLDGQEAFEIYENR